jgi:hypothetical protein
MQAKSVRRSGEAAKVDLTVSARFGWQATVGASVSSLMTFEEQLTRAFETLTERLRGDIDLQVQRAMAELVAAAPHDRDRDASDVPSTTGEMDIVVAAAGQEARASRARLADAVRSLDGARSLTQILDTLVNCARTEASSADVWLIRGGRLHRWRSPGSGGADHTPARLLDEPGPIAEAARTNAVGSADGTLAVPIAIAGSAVAVLYVELRTENLELRTHNVELLTRHAARCLESLTAFTAARALTQRPAEAEAADGSAPALDEASAEADTSARRYARLLVSEIKLYHESAVIDGRRDRDLATRLGGEIARARAMFEERVTADVRQRADYFHDELVRTLADGDASLLEARS